MGTLHSFEAGFFMLMIDLEKIEARR